MVRNVEDIEKAITQLPQDQLKEFRAWYEQFDSNAWDEQIERDAAAENSRMGDRPRFPACS